MKKKDRPPEKITKEQRAEIEAKDLPNFRDRKTQESQESQESKEPEEKEDSGPGADEVKEGDLLEIIEELADMPFQIWAIRNPNIPPLDPREKAIISKRGLKIAKRINATKFLKDEIVFFGAIGYSVLKRLRIQKNVSDNSGKKGKGKDEPGQEDHPI